MAGKIGVRLVRSSRRRSMLDQIKDAQKEVKDAARESGNEAKEIMEDIVSDWKNKPKFVVSTFVSGNGTEVFVEPIGPNAKFWEWTSRGTKPHIISAKQAPTLVFRTKYNAKTKSTKPPTWGGPGTSSGNLVRPKVVNHPGTKAREFEEFISGKVKKDFRRRVENAIRRALRR